MVYILHQNSKNYGEAKAKLMNDACGVAGGKRAKRVVEIIGWWSKRKMKLSRRKCHKAV
jgi:hypothetical protein